MSDGSDDRILEMVRRQLGRKNPPTTEALYGRAARIDPSIRDLTLRQFFAKYPLRVKRAQARRQKDEQGESERAYSGTPGTRDGHQSPRTPRNQRTEIRRILCEFGGEVAEAESRAALVKLIAEDLEDYVDWVLGVLAGE